MVGTKVSEEVESGNLFDQIDDLLDFQNDVVQETGDWDSQPFDIDSFPPVWLEESSALPSAGLVNHPSDVRYDDILQLEWLSNFVQDSLSKPKTFPTCHAKRARSKRPRPATFNPRSAIRLTLPSYFPVSHPLQKRPGRSKKKQKILSDGQTGNQNEPQNAYPLRKCMHCKITETPKWSMGPDGKTLCNTCVRHKSAAFKPCSVIHHNPPSYFPYSLPLKKRHVQPKKKQGIQSYGPINNQNEHRIADPPRKCTHCEITKTPQWRMGPEGPKTLCNACGVRYRSGRLLPEYRPVASPTFVPSLHSNSHRKVVELRESKNEDKTIQPDVFEKSDRLFPEYSPAASPSLAPSLHSNSPRKVLEIRKSTNEDDTIQPALFEKSDRLLPEYTPAASPTPVQSLHSNSSRKVVEIRKSTNEDETIQPALFEKSDRLLSEYSSAASPTSIPSLHSNSPQKVVEMRKSKNEDETIQPDLIQKSSSHKNSPEIRKCTSIVEVPVMVDLTHLPDLIPGSVNIVD